MLLLCYCVRTTLVKALEHSIAQRTAYWSIWITICGTVHNIPTRVLLLARLPIYYSLRRPIIYNNMVACVAFFQHRVDLIWLILTNFIDNFATSFIMWSSCYNVLDVKLNQPFLFASMWISYEGERSQFVHTFFCCIPNYTNTKKSCGFSHKDLICRSFFFASLV